MGSGGGGKKKPDRPRNCGILFDSERNYVYNEWCFVHGRSVRVRTDMFVENNGINLIQMKETRLIFFFEFELKFKRQEQFNDKMMIK